MKFYKVKKSLTGSINYDSLFAVTSSFTHVSMIADRQRRVCHAGRSTLVLWSFDRGVTESPRTVTYV